MFVKKRKIKAFSLKIFHFVKEMSWQKWTIQFIM